MLANDFQEKLKPTQDSQSSRLEERVAREKKEHEDRIKKIYIELDKPIPFKVSDMLRGKCMFASV